MLCLLFGQLNWHGGCSFLIAISCSGPQMQPVTQLSHRQATNSPRATFIRYITNTNNRETDISVVIFILSLYPFLGNHHYNPADNEIVFVCVRACAPVMSHSNMSACYFSPLLCLPPVSQPLAAASMKSQCYAIPSQLYYLYYYSACLHVKPVMLFLLDK